jgi:CheY-like chemotaxis protein/anti-sigma regulatory factor (Ser/Thr protein kinase)
VIEAAIDVVRPAAEAKGVSLETELDPAVGPVLGDPARLQQVIWNLLSNAVKFTPRRGRVEIRLRQLDSQAEIVVTDTGQGINAEFLPYVFERFRQADPASPFPQRGLGLGLAIVRDLVELHGGTVRAESVGKDHGATFTVKLPLSAVRVPVAAVTATDGRDAFPGSPPELQGVRVLLVDDEVEARESLTAVLEARGARVTAVGSVGETLDALDWAQPHVLISDIGMPGEDGYALIGQVRARPSERGGRVPAVALTGRATPEDRARALLAGFQLRVPKPVDAAELAAVVASLAARERSVPS